MLYLEYFHQFTLLWDSYTVYVSDGELKPLSVLSPKPPDSIEKNSNFNSQNTGVAGLPLPWLVSLFLLLCDFG